MTILLVWSDWSFFTSVKSWFFYLYELKNPVAKDVFCCSAKIGCLNHQSVYIYVRWPICELYVSQQYEWYVALLCFMCMVSIFAFVIAMFILPFQHPSIKFCELRQWQCILTCELKHVEEGLWAYKSLNPLHIVQRVFTYEYLAPNLATSSSRDQFLLKIKFRLGWSMASFNVSFLSRAIVWHCQQQDTRTSNKMDPCHFIQKTQWQPSMHSAKVQKCNKIFFNIQTFILPKS